MPLSDKAALKQQVFAQAEKRHVRFVSLQFTDIMGVVKNVHIPFHKFGDAVEHGLWFDGSSVEGFARIHESDMFLDPDLETFGIIPWERGDNATAKVICDVYTPDGEPFAGDPRGVLRRQLERAGSWATRTRRARSWSSSCCGAPPRPMARRQVSSRCRTMGPATST